MNRLFKLDSLGRATSRRFRKRTVRHRLSHPEQLEDRLLMSVSEPMTDNPSPTAAAEMVVSAPAALADALAATKAASGREANVADSLPERFESAEAFQKWLAEAAVAEWGHLFGRTTQYPYYTYPYLGFWDFDVSTPVFRNGFLNSSAPFITTSLSNDTTAQMTNDVAFSETNVQVAGVDEADLVETDGEYLYIVSGQDLVIVQPGTGEDLRVVSRVHLEDQPLGMYLSGDRLALVSSSPSTDLIRTIGNGSLLTPVTLEWGQYANTQPTTTVTVLDLSDRSMPTLVQRTELDGQLVTSRVVDRQLRLVVSNGIMLPPPIAQPVGEGGEPDPSAAPSEAEPIRVLPIIPTGLVADMSAYWPVGGDQQYVYETQEQYLDRISAELDDGALFGVRSLSVDGSVVEEQPLFDPTELYRPLSLRDRQVTTIATFDLNSDRPGPASTTSMMSSQPAEVYATSDSIFLFTRQARPWYADAIYSGVETRVWKFDVDAATADVSLVATGTVEGTLLNQFAADEQDGILRVVTTQSSWNSGTSLFVLEQVGERLMVVGQLEGIAPGERLHSVRFMDDRAFFITFQKVDPLFAVDLSTPTDPQLLGELVIPGYSDYLQPIDETHLLGIGRGADASIGLFQELQVSIFDVTELTDPQLLHRYSFDGGRSTVTPATGDRWTQGDGDHHAVSHFPAEQIFALPIFSASSTGGFFAGIDNTPLFEQGQGGLAVFTIDVGAGITPVTVITHDTLIERSVQIGDQLLAISSGTVSAHPLTDASVELGRISIAPDSNGGTPVELTMYQSPPEPFAVEPGELTDRVHLSRHLGSSLSSRPDPRRARARSQALAALRFTNHRPADADLLILLARETIRNHSTHGRGDATATAETSSPDRTEAADARFHRDGLATIEEEAMPTRPFRVVNR